MEMSIPKELEVKVITGSKGVSVKLEKGVYIVKLTSQPEKGKANKQLIDILSDYFNKPKSSIRIRSGKHARYKNVQIC